MDSCGPDLRDGSALEVLWFVFFQVSRNAKLYFERAVPASSLSLACDSMLVSLEGFRLLL